MQVYDYRLTEHSSEYDIAKAKEELKADIAREKPKAHNMYSAIQSDLKHKKRLGEAYNNRCAYCGVTLGCVDLHSFQLDHIVCEKAVEDGTAFVQAGLHSVENLAFSCRICNRKKSAFVFDDELYSILSPDEGLGSTFFRDVDYRIRVAADYEDNQSVIDFYEQMRFSYELRRVDYLLAGMWDFKQYLEGEGASAESHEIAAKLGSVLGELLMKRNMKSVDLLEEG